ncbi:MAG: hypothetical protein ABI333_30825 [bacterium]
METVRLKIADENRAIRYLGEVQSRPLDPIHEPIQNLIDEEASRIDIELDARRRQIRISGDARPIASLKEARQILQRICSSQKEGKLGEKGIGMLSFVNAGEWMVTRSQRGGRQVWFKLNRDRLHEGEVGSHTGGPPLLTYSGTEVVIGKVPARYFKTRFSRQRVARGVRRRWAQLMHRGVQFTLDGDPLRPEDESLEGDPIQRELSVTVNRRQHRIRVALTLLTQPADAACVSVEHRGQANFDIGSVPLFAGSAFTVGWLHGTISGDMAPLNASRTGFQESREFERWQDAVLELHDELEQQIDQRSRAAAEARDQAVIDDFMKHLKQVFRGTELESVTTVLGRGDDQGWGEERSPDDPPSEDSPSPDEPGDVVGGETDAEADAGGEQSTADEPSRAPIPRTPTSSQRGGRGRLPTVPHGGFGEFAPSIRVWRGRKEFKINVKHSDYLAALKNTRKRRSYIREICLHEAYIFSLEGARRKQAEAYADELLGYWTTAFVKG